MSARQRVVAGRCPTCGARVVRGQDDSGALVVTDVMPATAAQELGCRAEGRRSYVLAWAGVGMKLTPRTDRDVLLSPPGFTHARIVCEHHCKAGAI
jgi:hypothetical protein